MSLESGMKPKRPAIQTRVELRITPLNLARVGQPKQLPSTNLSLMKPLCVSLKQEGRVSDKERTTKDKWYWGVVSFGKQVTLQLLQVPPYACRKEVDLRTGDTYFEPSASVLRREKSGEVNPKITKGFLSDNNLRLNGGRSLIISATSAKGGGLQISMMQQG